MMMINLSEPIKRPKFSVSENIDEEQDDEYPKTVEESPNYRWSKLNSEISVQKLIDFDTTHLAIDNERGCEVAWNEMIYSKYDPSKSRFLDQSSLELIHEKLKPIFNFLIKIDHPNLLKFYDYWYNENENECKLVVITEYSSAGPLKKLLDSSKSTQTRIKEHTYKRWLNQIIYTIKSLHDNKMSLFQGHLNSLTIFIQNSGVIKLSPTLLSLNGLCDIVNNDHQIIKCSIENKANINLNSTIVKKDLHAIGILAIDIFTAHLKLTPTSPQKIFGNRMSVQFEMLNQMLDDVHEIQQLEEYIDLIRHLDDQQQRNFVLKCFNGESNDINTVWYHPYINSIHNLKVLSVFSILNYFQEDDKPRRMSSSLTTPPSIIQKSSSSSSLTKSNSLNQIKFSNFSEKRKCSLTFLTQEKNLKIPQDFFGILEDIRAGLYPRLFKNKDNLNSSSSSYKLRAISSSSCLDFVLQQKQLLDRRSSFMMNSEGKNSITSLARIDSHEGVEGAKDEVHKYPIETRRVIQEDCSITQDKDTEIINLNLDLQFDDNLSRRLTSVFPASFLSYLKADPEIVDCNNNNNISPKSEFYLGVNQDTELLGLLYGSNCNEFTFESKLENISTHLANELIDQGLINPNDHSLIADLLLKTIRDFLIQL